MVEASLRGNIWTRTQIQRITTTEEITTAACPCFQGSWGCHPPAQEQEGDWWRMYWNWTVSATVELSESGRRNARTLFHAAYKVTSQIIHRRLSSRVNEDVLGYQAAFFNSRPMADQMFTERQMLQKYHEYQAPTQCPILFIDFEAARRMIALIAKSYGEQWTSTTALQFTQILPKTLKGWWAFVPAIQHCDRGCHAENRVWQSKYDVIRSNQLVCFVGDIDYTA